MILDSHGEVAARICTILLEKGYLEADAIAEIAMLPGKDTREVSCLAFGVRLVYYLWRLAF